MPESPVHALVEFTRLVSSAATPAQVMPVLVDVAVSMLGVDGAAVLSIAGSDRLELVASRGLPERVAGWTTDADLIGPELGRALVEACGGELPEAEVLPLVSGGDLFGVLVLLARDAAHAPDARRRELAAALAGLAASVAERTASHAQLQRSYDELRASREALARTERLRLLGQMAGGVSHDLKNILNPLGLQLELLRRRCERDDKDGVLAAVATMRDVITHGVEVVDRLRVFSREGGADRAEVVDLERVIATAIDLTRPRVEQHGIALHHVPGDAAAVAARAAELTTSVVNLIVNSVDAMGGRGTITVTSGTSDGGGWVEVADDGAGMPPEIQQHVFEPFFTTKPDGTGLGLAMIATFVERFAGKVSVHSASDEGTRIRIWLPGFR